MKYWILLFFCISIIACKKENITTPASSSFDDTEDSYSMYGKPGYILIWSDEFNYTGLPNPVYWGYEKGYIRNDEKQYYTEADTSNSKVENGMLMITARFDSTQNHPHNFGQRNYKRQRRN